MLGPLPPPPFNSSSGGRSSSRRCVPQKCQPPLLAVAALLFFLPTFVVPSSAPGQGSEAEACTKQLTFEEAMRIGVSFSRSSNHEAALPCLQHATELRPRNPGAQVYLGESMLRLKRWEEAILHLEKASELDPTKIVSFLLLATAAVGGGDREKARKAYENALQLDPKSAPGLINFGSLLRELGEFDAALDSYIKATQSHPSTPEGHLGVASLLLEEGSRQDLKGAILSARRAGNVKGCELTVFALERMGSPREGLREVEGCLVRLGKSFSLGYQLGRMLKATGRLSEAVAEFRNAIKGGGGGAQEVAYAYNEMGHAYSAMGRDKDAVKQWKKAVTVDPTFARGWVNVGAAEGGSIESIDSYTKALQLDPTLAEGWINIGQVYYNNFRKDPSYMSHAKDAFSQALVVEPESASALFSFARVCVDLCQWQKYSTLWPSVTSKIESGLAARSLLTTSISLVHMLVFPIEDSTIDSVYRAKAEAIASLQIVAEVAQSGRARGAKGVGLKLGYVSADLGEHPVGLLFSRVPKIQSKGGLFETSCVSLKDAEREDDRVKREIQDGCGEFVDVSGLSLGEALGAIESLDLDILIEMNGYTQHARPELVAHSKTSLRISFLGFAHSLMSSFIDLLVTDSTATPTDLWRSPERAMVFPLSFYLTNHASSFHSSHLSSPSALPYVTKTQVGLREGSFVFASFNQPFKITPDLFDVWMRILILVPDSQLWLLKLNEGEGAEENLRTRARSLGIEDWRLFFTGSAALEDHIGYKSAADLMLDAVVFNGHSTVADTLWAGVPVLTRAGTRMAARICSSLLRGVEYGQANLGHVTIARDLTDYQRIAVRLGNCPSCMSRLRARLVESRLSSPLFDTERWVSDWERGLKMAWELRGAQSGGSRHHIVITAIKEAEVPEEAFPSEGRDHAVTGAQMDSEPAPMLQGSFGAFRQSEGRMTTAWADGEDDYFE